MDLEVVIEGVSDVGVANDIRRRIQKVCKETERSGEWSIMISPSEMRGQWDLGVREPSGRHFVSFPDPERIDQLPALIAVYFRAFCVELTREGIPFEEQKVIQVTYRGVPIHTHRIDLLVGGQVIVELKAVARIEPIHISQVVSYLRATDLRIGLLMNFNVRALRLGLRRVVR